MKRYIRRIYAQEEKSLNLIASENIMAKEVREVYGWERTTKYCEGYGVNRYYSGCREYNHIEETTKRRALSLFKLSEKKWDSIVQPYSGSIANFAIYAGCLEKGDALCGLDISAGGHLSHGSKASNTSKLFKTYYYGVTDKYDIDYGAIERIVKKERPKMIISGASAFPGKISFKRIGEIAKKYNSIHLADISHYAGLASAGMYPSPFPYADIVMTTTHKTLQGPRGACIFIKKESGLYQKIAKSLFPGTQGGPHMNTIAAIGTGLLLAKNKKGYYKQVVANAKILKKTLEEKGLTTLGKTDSHMVLMSLKNTPYNGKEAQEVLESIGILSNGNMIYGDDSPQKPSGIRFGTYALTARGAKEKDMIEIGSLISDLLQKKTAKNLAKKKVQNILRNLKSLETREI